MCRSPFVSFFDPKILSGGGVVMAGGVDDVVALAEKLSAPVCTTYLHNDAFPKSNKLWMGENYSQEV